MEPEAGLPHEPRPDDPSPIVEEAPGRAYDDPVPPPAADRAPEIDDSGETEGEELDELAEGDRGGEGGDPEGGEPAAGARAGAADPSAPRADFTNSFSFGETHAESITQAHTVYQQFGGEGAARRPERLARRHFQSLDQRALGRRLRGVEWPAATLAACERHVERSRLLILVGAAGWGKGTLALALGERLLQRRPEARQVLVGGRPRADLQVDLPRLAAEARECVMVLEDAFVHRNPSLCRLVEQLDAARLQELEDALRGADSWVVLTTSDEALPGDPARLAALGACHAAADRGADDLRRTLHRLAQLRLAGDGTVADDRQRVEDLLAAAAEAICARLRTVPRLAAFVDAYLLATARGEIDWEDAADRVDGLAGWMLEEMAEERSAWSFVTALTLASAVPRGGDPPLLQFDLLWRRLDRTLCAAAGDEEPAARTLAELGIGERLLCRARAELAGARPATIRFRDPSTAERLWHVLLDGPGRQAAGLLVPWLRGLTDADDGAGDLREAAGRALGRLGAVDPERCSLPLIDRWIRDDSGRSFDGTLGALLQGIVASGDEDYLDTALRRLAAAAGRGDRQSHFARAAALRDLGAVDLGLALAELQGPATETADDLLERLRQAERDVRPALARLAARRGPGGTVPEDVRQQRFSAAVARRVPQGIQDRFEALRYGLIGLCLSRDPVAVLDGLRPWLSRPREAGSDADPVPSLHALTALALLSEQGVLHWLESHPLPAGRGEEREARVSRTLLAAATDADAPGRLAAALADALAASDDLPTPLSSVLRANWRTVLAAWGGSRNAPALLEATRRELFRRLLALPAGGAADETFDLLQREACFRTEDGRLDRFAAEVLAG